MSTSITEWNVHHIHPRGTWWQYVNDQRFGEGTLLGLAFMAVLSVGLIAWAVSIA